MKHSKSILVLLIAVLLAGCGPGQFLGPTVTPTFTKTPPPTMTPTATPTPTLTPTPTEVKVNVRLCAMGPTGEPAGGAYFQVSDADYTQVFPNDGTTGKQAGGSGCLLVKLPPGIYHVRSQDVVNPIEGVYIYGGAEIEVLLGEPLKVEINLDN